MRFLTSPNPEVADSCETGLGVCDGSIVQAAKENGKTGARNRKHNGDKIRLYTSTLVSLGTCQRVAE